MRVLHDEHLPHRLRQLFVTPTEKKYGSNMNRITFNPDQCGGRPCIQGIRK